MFWYPRRAEVAKRRRLVPQIFERGWAHRRSRSGGVLLWLPALVLRSRVNDLATGAPPCTVGLAAMRRVRAAFWPMIFRKTLAAFPDHDRCRIDGPGSLLLPGVMQLRHRTGLAAWKRAEPSPVGCADGQTRLPNRRESVPAARIDEPTRAPPTRCCRASACRTTSRRNCGGLTRALRADGRRAPLHEHHPDRRIIARSAAPACGARMVSGPDLFAAINSGRFF